MAVFLVFLVFTTVVFFRICLNDLVNNKMVKTKKGQEVSRIASREEAREYKRYIQKSDKQGDQADGLFWGVESSTLSSSAGDGASGGAASSSSTARSMDDFTISAPTVLLSNTKGGTSSFVSVARSSGVLGRRSQVLLVRRQNGQEEAVGG